jgi:hypothetical protein
MAKLLWVCHLAFYPQVHILVVAEDKAAVEHQVRAVHQELPELQEHHLGTPH